MKRAIEVADIRKGDLIRAEYPHALVAAREYRADRDGHALSTLTKAGAYYLLDRPTPPVELPATATLGWATIFDPTAGGTRGVELGIWQGADNRGRSVNRGADRLLQRDREFDTEHLAEFVAAVAVPKDALEALQAERPAAGCCVGCRSYIAARDFLAAIDEVKG